MKYTIYKDSKGKRIYGMITASSIEEAIALTFPNYKIEKAKKSEMDMMLLDKNGVHHYFKVKGISDPTQKFIAKHGFQLKKQKAVFPPTYDVYWGATVNYYREDKVYFHCIVHGKSDAQIMHHLREYLRKYTYEQDIAKHFEDMLKYAKKQSIRIKGNPDAKLSKAEQEAIGTEIAYIVSMAGIFQEAKNSIIKAGKEHGEI